MNIQTQGFFSLAIICICNYFYDPHTTFTLYLSFFSANNHGSVYMIFIGFVFFTQLGMNILVLRALIAP